MVFYLDRYDTFIFDFDGTIADTLPLCFDSFRQVFLTFNNEEMSDDNIESWFGPSEIGIIENNLKNKADSKRAVDLYYDLYKKNHSSFVKQKKEINSLLLALISSGKKIAIVTGKGRISYDISIKELELEKFIDYSIASEDVVNPKPNGEGIIKTVNHFDTSLEKAIYFGDSNADILAANDAGIDSVGVSWFYPKTFDVSPTFLSASPIDII
ncbi:HAD family hydrolase [Vagococcus carniphilus]|uniref:HAD family hydrolase n=1 Tax=Vagococcus carniphilus TaxID=218144 RepID=UPI003BA8BB95